MTLLRGLWARRYDLGVLAGAVLVALAVGAIYRPAGVITLGLAIAAWSLMGARTEAAERATKRRQAMLG